MSLTISSNSYYPLLNCIKVENSDLNIYKYTNTSSIYFNSGSTYNLTMKIYSECKEPFSLYIKPSNKTAFDNETNIGKLIDVVKIDKLNTIINYNINIRPKYNGTGSLCFAFNYGSYYISDINLVPFYDDNYSPDEAVLIIPTPLDKRKEDISLTIKYIGGDGLSILDSNNILFNTGVSSKTIYKNFIGSNLVVTNDDNLIEGSIFIGSQLRTGIELSGGASGLIKSVGYQGFNSASKGIGDGFLIYSGSVYKYGIDNYSGVGFEMVASTSSYFRFRTDKYQKFIEISTDIFNCSNISTDV